MAALLSSPLSSLFGGILIGISATAVFIFLGRVAGISRIVGDILSGHPEKWRIGFVAGLLLGGVVLLFYMPQVFAGPNDRSLPLLAVAGLLVGVGTRMGNGCTSGHGICGISRFAPRSLAATATFLATGFAAATLFSLLGGGQ